MVRRTQIWSITNKLKQVKADHRIIEGLSLSLSLQVKYCDIAPVDAVTYWKSNNHRIDE